MDRDSRPWWEALGRHELVLQRCADCSAWRWPAREMCGRCGSFSWTWQPLSGRGTLNSWIVNHHQFSADLPSPYVVATVRLDEQEDLLLLGGFDDAGGPPVIDAPVVAGFLDARSAEGEPFTLLVWRVEGTG
jgi:uncharacterized OB-fold protein